MCLAQSTISCINCSISLTFQLTLDVPINRLRMLSFIIIISLLIVEIILRDTCDFLSGKMFKNEIHTAACSIQNVGMSADVFHYHNTSGLHTAPFIHNQYSESINDKLLRIETNSR